MQDYFLATIVVLTAHQGSEYRHKALKPGARDFLTKPFDSIELLARIRNLIEMHKNLKLANKQKIVL